MTSLEIAGATRVAPQSSILSSNAPVRGSSLTADFTKAEAASARATLAAFHGGRGGGHGPIVVHPGHGGHGHGPIIVVPRPHFPHRHGPIIVVPLPIPSVGFHMCYPGEEFTAREVRQDAFGRYWCSNF